MVELSLLLLARPHDRPPAGVDAVCKLHPAVVCSPPESSGPGRRRRPRRCCGCRSEPPPATAGRCHFRGSPERGSLLSFGWGDGGHQVVSSTAPAWSSRLASRTPAPIAPSAKPSRVAEVGLAGEQHPAVCRLRQALMSSLLAPSGNAGVGAPAVGIGAPARDQHRGRIGARPASRLGHQLAHHRRRLFGGGLIQPIGGTAEDERDQRRAASKRVHVQDRNRRLVRLAREHDQMGEVGVVPERAVEAQRHLLETAECEPVDRCPPLRLERRRRTRCRRASALPVARSRSRASRGEAVPSAVVTSTPPASTATATTGAFWRTSTSEAMAAVTHPIPPIGRSPR